MADGGDQLPSSRRATITPDPNRPEPKKPALKTVQIISPYAVSQWVIIAARYDMRVFVPLHFVGRSRGALYLDSPQMME